LAKSARRRSPCFGGAFPGTALWAPLCAAALCVGGTPVRAQGPVEGALRGRVVDARGRPVAHARVTVSGDTQSLDTQNGDTQNGDAQADAGLALGEPLWSLATSAPTQRMLQAGADGGFVLLRLPPGRYRVAAGGEGVVVLVRAGEIAEVRLTAIGVGGETVLAEIVALGDAVLQRADATSVEATGNEGS